MRMWTLMCLAAVLAAACSSSDGGSDDVEYGAPGEGEGGAGDAGGNPGQGGQPGTGGGGQGGKNTGGSAGKPQECNSFNCEGCCWEGTCHTGTTEDACGANAELCHPCLNNQICKSGGVCGVDPNGMWRVQPVSAKIASTNNGTAWDSDSSPPDVEVYGTCPSSSPSSPTYGVAPEYASYTPTWDSGGCVTTAGALLASPWKYQLMDVDYGYDDTITGVLEHQIIEDEFFAQWFSVGPSGGMVTMKVMLQKQ